MQRCEQLALPGTTIDTGAELLWLRQDWMDKLNLEAPKSLEDVEAILKAFVENDPDGNGTNDTIGMILSNEIYGKYGGSPMYANNVFAAFGATPGQWIEKDGQVVYGKGGVHPAEPFGIPRRGKGGAI